MSEINAAKTQEDTITEESLQKALSDLEGKKEQPAEEKEPVVSVTELEKKVRDTVEEMGTESLKKSLDVSEVLDEVVALVGIHVDRSLEALQKSIGAAAQRDNSVLKVLEALKKSIDDNTAAVEKLMEQPGAPASTQAVTASEAQVLEKTAGSAPQLKAVPDAQSLRKSISNGLEKMCRQHGVQSGEGSRIAQVVVKFETTGEISDEDMAAALKADKA